MRRAVALLVLLAALACGACGAPLVVEECGPCPPACQPRAGERAELVECGYRVEACGRSVPARRCTVDGAPLAAGACSVADARGEVGWVCVATCDDTASGGEVAR